MGPAAQPGHSTAPQQPSDLPVLWQNTHWDAGMLIWGAGGNHGEALQQLAHSLTWGKDKALTLQNP